MNEGMSGTKECNERANEQHTVAERTLSLSVNLKTWDLHRSLFLSICVMMKNPDVFLFPYL